MHRLQAREILQRHMPGMSSPVSLFLPCRRVRSPLLIPTNATTLIFSSVRSKKSHWPSHKRECKKRAAEILDERLFKTPPPKPDCPICFLPLPPRSLDESGFAYHPCCGQVLCSGCTFQIRSDATKGNKPCLCPFCRTRPHTSLKEAMSRANKRIQVNDGGAFEFLGSMYFGKTHPRKEGLRQDQKRACELYLKAGELGSADGYICLAGAYYNGEGVKKDVKKAIHFYQKSAILGHEEARHNLGAFEQMSGNVDRAAKHYAIAASAGFDNSLTNLRSCFLKGHANKDEYETALRAHKMSHDEAKSEQRDKARGAYQQMKTEIFG
ncbi:hypothetical protein ACHAWF_001659 [Thalassiosira exigua]